MLRTLGVQKIQPCTARGAPGVGTRGTSAWLQWSRRAAHPPCSSHDEASSPIDAMHGHGAADAPSTGDTQAAHGGGGLHGIAQLILDGRATRIICMCGAGISVSAGIPDFRTPGTGLFSQLEKFGTLQKPEDIFDIDVFREDPRPFHLLAKELLPGRFSATPAHHFFRLLHDKGLLLRVFSQNIDSLETQAGLPADALVAAHGNFDAAHCIRCGDILPIAHFKAAIDSDSICKCPSCQGLVKPRITFYGEDLPERFYSLVPEDFPLCDLLIVMGTSLAVYPFASLIYRVRPGVPRLLINREPAGGIDPLLRLQDHVYLGDCDEGVMELAGLLGWKEELEALIKGGTLQ